jgi:hypothetical protein
MGKQGMLADIELLVDGETLTNILADSAEELASLTATLNS